MSELILVKHAMPLIDPLLPACQWRLSEEGRAGALGLAKHLEALRPDVIVASTEPKAAETAHIVAQHLERRIELHDGLREHDRRNVPFLGRDELEEAVSRFFAQPSRLVFGEETADEAHVRFRDAVTATKDSHERSTAVIVAHGTVITLFLSRLLGLEPFPLWRSLGLPSFAVLSRPQLELLQLREAIA